MAGGLITGPRDDFVPHPRCKIVAMAPRAKMSVPQSKQNCRTKIAAVSNMVAEPDMVVEYKTVVFYHVFYYVFYYVSKFTNFTLNH